MTADRPGGEGAAEFGLVMPFLTVTSAGGPHDDEGYVCGYEMGALDGRLEHGRPDRHEQMVHAANLRQADLIAMRRGYRLDVVTDDGEWAAVVVTRTGESSR